jgi:tripartite ATP-independent transporter DctP family solute receptor
MRSLKVTLVVVIITALMVTLLGGCAQNKEPEQGSDPSQEKITIRLGTTVQPNMPSGQAAEKFCELITERTDGRVTVEYYPARQLGEADDQAAQLVNGTLEMAQLANSTISAFTDLITPVQLPFLIADYDKLEKALKSNEMRSIYDKIAEETGVVILTGMEHGMRYIGNNIRPINAIEDCNGLKLRVAASDNNFAAVKAIGANPTSIAYGELYSALQSKVIDGEEINYTSVYAEKHYEVLDYFSEVALWPYPCVLGINAEFFNGLSEEDQQLFRDTASECLEYNLELIKDYEEEAKSAMLEAGVKINKLDDITPFIEATKHLYDECKKIDPVVADFIEMAEGL